jgi:hypothetical protein
MLYRGFDVKTIERPFGWRAQAKCSLTQEIVFADATTRDGAIAKIKTLIDKRCAFEVEAASREIDSALAAKKI